MRVSGSMGASYRRSSRGVHCGHPAYSGQFESFDEKRFSVFCESFGVLSCGRMAIPVCYSELPSRAAKIEQAARFRRGILEYGAAGVGLYTWAPAGRIRTVL